jgi:hypothetical protein
VRGSSSRRSTTRAPMPESGIDSPDATSPSPATAGAGTRVAGGGGVVVPADGPSAAAGAGTRVAGGGGVVIPADGPSAAAGAGTRVAGGGGVVVPADGPSAAAGAGTRVAGGGGVVSPADGPSTAAGAGTRVAGGGGVVSPADGAPERRTQIVIDRAARVDRVASTTRGRRRRTGIVPGAAGTIRADEPLSGAPFSPAAVSRRRRSWARCSSSYAPIMAPGSMPMHSA